MEVSSREDTPLLLGLKKSRDDEGHSVALTVASDTAASPSGSPSPVRRAMGFWGVLLTVSVVIVGGLMYSGSRPMVTSSATSKGSSLALKEDAVGTAPSPSTFGAPGDVTSAPTTGRATSSPTSGASMNPTNGAPSSPTSGASMNPTSGASPAPSSVVTKPINPEVEFLGPTTKGTAIKKGSLVGYGIALPDDFQVQFDFQGLLAQSGSSNILHVTTGTGTTSEYSEQCTPCAYWLESGKLFLQWSIYNSGVGSVTTKVNLRASEWYTIYLSPRQTMYNMLYEVYDSTYTMVDSGDMNFNAQMSADSRSAYVYASDQFSTAANGNIKNIIFREWTYAPTKAPTFAPTYYISSKPINPEVEFLGPTNDGTTITKNQVVGYGIALPDDFQVQFDYYPGIAKTGSTNILHVTSGTGATAAESEQCTPCAYATESGPLFLQWSIYKGGVGSVTTNVKLPALNWYTIYLTPRQTMYSMIWEIYDNQGNLLDSGDMSFNSKMSASSRDVYVYASDQFSNAANGKVRNMIFREYASAPTKRPTAMPTQAPTSSSNLINPEVEYLGPSLMGTKLVAGNLVGSGIALPDEFQVEFTFMPYSIQTSQNNILHTTSYLGTGEDAEQQMVPAVYTSSTNPGALLIEWQVYKSGKAASASANSVSTNRALVANNWYQVFITISQTSNSVTVEIYDNEGNLYDQTDMKIDSQMVKGIRSAYVYASDSFGSAADGQIRNIIFREYALRPTQKPTFRPSALPSPRPTDHPTALPTNAPSDRPSYEPTFHPSAVPSHTPTEHPTDSPSFRPTTLEPTVIHGTAQPTQGMRPINPEVEFLGPSEQGTAVAQGFLAGSGIGLPDDFQVQFEYYPNSVSTTANNILYVTTKSDRSDEARGNIVPGIYSSTTGSLQIQWEISNEGRSRTITSRPLETRSWHTVVLSVMMSRMDLMVEVYDSNGNLYDSADMPFNAKLGEGSRSVFVYASNEWDTAADGQIRNVIFRELTSMPTDEPTPKPTDRPTRVPSPVPSEIPTAIPTHSPSFVPTHEPTKEPTFEPSQEPTDRPTRDPTAQPTHPPTPEPTDRPTSDPTNAPSAVPTETPTERPTHAPTHRPSNRPSHSPTDEPTEVPSERPTPTPEPTNSVHPPTATDSPTLEPTHKPSQSPSMEPTETPTDVPTYKPSDAPTMTPSSEPSSDPTHNPSSAPTDVPTFPPTEWPSALPSEGPTPVPSQNPSSRPTQLPSAVPTEEPTFGPTYHPTFKPTTEPSDRPTLHPTDHPTFVPSREPTDVPTHTPSEFPTLGPTDVDTPIETPSESPTHAPSHTPTHSPTDEPTAQPTELPTEKPSFAPTDEPTKKPTFAPTNQPSFGPTDEPTRLPTQEPSLSPTDVPSVKPTKEPSFEPSPRPSRAPTDEPTEKPSEQPTEEPSAKPTFKPSAEPSFGPTELPTFVPTHKPTDSEQPLASGEPTPSPTHRLSDRPSAFPSESPTDNPTHTPSALPTFKPSSEPSYEPSKLPTHTPSFSPSQVPSTYPSFGPSAEPSYEPSHSPSERPTFGPTDQPTLIPTHTPSNFPTWMPTEEPTAKPSHAPSALPTWHPTNEPTFKPTNRPTDSDTDIRTGHPSAVPSHEPTERPSHHPSSDPTFKPTHVPTDKPQFNPTDAPSQRPTRSPSFRPSQQPTDGPTAKPTTRPTIVIRKIHSPTQEPTIMHDKVEYPPTPRPNGKTDDDEIHTYDDDWTYGDENKASSSKRGTDAERGSNKDKKASNKSKSKSKSSKKSKNKAKSSKD